MGPETRATKIHMTPEQEAQFYATILAGILANKDIGGFPEDKINTAIQLGRRLKTELGIKETKPTVLKG